MNEMKILYNFIYEFMMNNYDIEIDFWNVFFLDWIDGIERDLFFYYVRQFYFYCMLFILIFGFFGNVFLLCVFLLKNFWSFLVSIYLVVLFVFDFLVFVFYVFVEWFCCGLVYLDLVMKSKILFFDGDVVCQFQFYVFYVLWFLLVWIVVVFMFERYISVCWLLLRKDFCIKRWIKCVIVGIVVILVVVVFYKLIFSVIYVSGEGNYYCIMDKDYGFFFFILDSIYVILIMLVFFLVIVVFNILIVWKLIL